jgi:nitrite reductase/ring-hydroxylating ferredoxin subunit
VQSPAQENEIPGMPRRRILQGGLFCALATTYSVLTAYALRFIFPERRGRPEQRLFLGFANELPPGASRAIALPSGDTLIVSNTSAVGAAGSVAQSHFVGYSSVCPHLGCKVHWSATDHQFVCPCHQGVFDVSGNALSGPPAQSGARLRPYTIQAEGNSVYVVLGDSPESQSPATDSKAQSRSRESLA